MRFKCEKCKINFVKDDNESVCERCKKKEAAKYTSMEIRLKACPRCKRNNALNAEDCIKCGFSFITGRPGICPNCKKPKANNYYCICGFDFRRNTFLNFEVEYFDIVKDNRYKIKSFDRVNLNGNKLVCHWICIGDLPEQYKKDSLSKTILIKSRDFNKVSFAISELPEPLLIPQIEKKIKEEEEIERLKIMRKEEALKHKKILLEKQYIAVGYREARCHSCSKGLNTKENLICEKCKWILCDCGSCGCNYHSG